MQESERLARDKNASLQLLQKVAQPGGGGVGGFVGVGRGVQDSSFTWSPLLSLSLLSDSLPLWACRRRRN